MTALLLRLMGLGALQRAEDANPVRRWQPPFVPHMRTRMLDRLNERPTEWPTSTSWNGNWPGGLDDS